jgi:hypothetical protein
VLVDLLTWTKEVPTKEGWYWLNGIGSRVIKGHLQYPSIVRVYLEGHGQRKGLFVCYNGLDANEDDAIQTLVRNCPDVEWAGPIQEPT